MLPINTDRKPIVAIVGAGIAGLTLAILLQKQGVEYNIYERAREIRPLGASIGLNPPVINLFKQMGIYEEVVEASKVFYKMEMYKANRELDYVMDMTQHKQMGGFNGRMIPRYVFYEILLRQIPKERIHLNKKVLSFIQNKNGVMLRTWDNQTHDADILIGADGAYSATRQSLYADLRGRGELPESDNEPLPFTTVCLVGNTRPLDPEVFVDLKLPHSLFIKASSEDNAYTWNVIITNNNTICWSVSQYLDEVSAKDHDSFRNSEWGPEAAEQMCNEVRDFGIPGAAKGARPLTMGDLIDQSPKEYISKVMLEEKVFETWNSRRTALMGDACHKVSPAAGQGAANAIHDAACLANWISILPSTELKDVEWILNEYKKERYPFAKESFATSQMFRHLGGKTLRAQLTRLMFKHKPNWLWRIILTKMVLQRPQVSFLPLVEDKGTVKPAYQTSLHQTLKLAEVAAAVRNPKAV